MFRLKGSVNEKLMPVIVLGAVTPSGAQVMVTVDAVAVTGTETLLVPHVEPVHVPQLLGLPAESFVRACVLGVETCIDSPTVPVPLDTGPMVPDIVNDIPVYAEASIAQAPA